MTGTAITLSCLGLVVLDFAARTWRTQLFLRHLGHPLPFREVFVQSAIGETASSLTPLRAGGEPARIWVMRRQGLPGPVALVCVGIELVATSAVILLTAIVLAVTVAPDWWVAAGPGLVRSAARSGPWLAAVAAATLLAWLVVRHVRADLLHVAGNVLAATRGHLRDLPLWVYLAQVPLTLLNIGARVAVLPVLAQALDQPPPLAATVMGSFALLYSQAVIPTPAGAGAVEVGFLGGAAGNLGAAESALLVEWRVYTTVLGTVLGVVVALWRFPATLPPFVGRWRARAAGSSRRADETPPDLDDPAATDP